MPPTPPPPESDLLIIGAGAAGLMAAIAARGAIDSKGTPQSPAPDAPSVVVLDGSSRLGLKILVSGGGRCNVTNERVDERDFDSDAPKLVRGTLRELPSDAVRAYFEQRGCPLYAEPLGKLFPRSERARDVLSTLLAAVEDAGVAIEPGTLVTDVRPSASHVDVETDKGVRRAGRVLIATGGKSLPKTGSQGFGLDLAARLGHDLDPPRPALAPIEFVSGSAFLDLAGVTVPVLLSLIERGIASERVESPRYRPIARAGGSMLFTHVGASGPAALDVSGACGGCLDAGDDVVLEADFVRLALADGPFAPYLGAPKSPGASLPGDEAVPPLTFDEFVEATAARRAENPHRTLSGMLGCWMPRSLSSAALNAGGLDAAMAVSSLAEGAWRAVHWSLCHADLEVAGTDGYAKAEVTRGGVRLRELRRNSFESRLAARVHFCGEVASATGRLGGFNFQWAWSSGYVAGRGAARLLRQERQERQEREEREEREERDERAAPQS